MVDLKNLLLNTANNQANNASSDALLPLHLQKEAKQAAACAKPRSPVLFIGLNVVRALSIISLLLVVASSIVYMVSDIRGVNAWIQAGVPSSGRSTSNPTSSSSSNPYWTGNNTSSSSSPPSKLELIQGTTIPNQVGGPFYSILNRLILILSCFILVAAEVGGPACIRRFFEWFVPPLGPAHGTAVLGFLQCFIGTTILSHRVSLFVQASSWTLFILGCLNLLLGFFSTRVKTTRAIFSFENLSTLTPQTSIAYNAYSFASKSDLLPFSASNSESKTGKGSFPTFTCSTSAFLSRSKREAKADLREPRSARTPMGYPSYPKEQYPDEPSPRYETFQRNPGVGKIPGVTFGGQKAKPKAEVYLKKTSSSASRVKGPGGHGEGVERDGGWGNYGKKGESLARMKGYVISKPGSVQPKP